eukprot:TCONS_00009363-protein
MGETSRPFIKTPIGVTMLINIVFLFITWCLIISWRYGDELREKLAEEIEWKVNFFFISIFMVWILMCVLFATFSLGKCMNQRCFTMMVVLGGLLGALVIVASGFIALEAKRHKCTLWNCRMVDATAAFGFLCTIGLVVQAFMYFFFHIYKHRS